jgi:ABC-type nitrate/sulfonate/bicarbonate transport system permease component
MYFILCFLYCFFAIVLGTYLGFELVSVRRAERVYRTMLKGSEAVSAIAETAPTPTPTGEANYFGR